MPAFTGLGAPWWDPTARGLLIGITRGTGLADIARATIDSIAYQVRDVLDGMAAEVTGPAGVLRVDGGAARNDSLLQFQADLLGVPVERPVVTETTAAGAAFLAGLAVGTWSGLEEIEATWALDRRFEPVMDAATRDRLVAGWRGRSSAACTGRSIRLRDLASPARAVVAPSRVELARRRIWSGMRDWVLGRAGDGERAMGCAESAGRNAAVRPWTRYR